VRCHGNEIKPGMAESCEISGTLTYTFHLLDACGATASKSPRATSSPACGPDGSVHRFQQRHIRVLHCKRGTVNTGEKPAESLASRPDEKTLEITLVNPTATSWALGNAYFYPTRADILEKYGDSFATSPETTSTTAP
jgi:ABC-type oligopeptide transport system substrate-binding subunit